MGVMEGLAAGGGGGGGGGGEGGRRGARDKDKKHGDKCYTIRDKREGDQKWRKTCFQILPRNDI